mmetsp:Transcript_34063/g.80352  ORF Transcript_34063/g.80352 Transcript_34063/m.80352 type:complete len:304 (-) Transcript_34063:380-1291(-)
MHHVRVGLCLVLRLRAARLAGLPRPLHRGVAQNRPDQLVDHNAGCYDSLELRAPARKQMPNFRGKTEREAGLRQQRHPYCEVDSPLLPHERATNEARNEDARHPEQGKDDGEGKRFDEDLEVETCSNEGKEWEKDVLRSRSEHINETMMVLAEVDSEESTDDAHQQRFGLDGDRLILQSLGDFYRQELACQENQEPDWEHQEVHHEPGELHEKHKRATDHATEENRCNNRCDHNSQRFRFKRGPIELRSAVCNGKSHGNQNRNVRKHSNSHERSCHLSLALQVSHNSDSCGRAAGHSDGCHSH